MAGRRVPTGSLYDQGESRLVAGEETWIVRAGPQGGVPVVFLHGAPTSAYLWRDVMRALHEERDCLALDWRGFGHSAKPREGDYTHAARAAQLRATLDALGIPRAVLVGHELGGSAALLFAAQEPARVAALALVDTTLYRRDLRPPLPALTQMVPVVRDLARPFLHRGAFELFFRQGLARPERMPRDVLDHHWRLAMRDGGKRSVLAAWAQLAQGMPALEALRAKLGELKMPMLLLHGAEDRWVPVSHAERLAKAMPGARLQVMEGVGHFAMEDAPEEVADLLASFLEQEVA